MRRASDGTVLSELDTALVVPHGCGDPCRAYGLERGEIRAYELPAAAPRWSAQVFSPSGHGTIACARATGGVALLEVDWASTPSAVAHRYWLALDQADGTILWRRGQEHEHWLCPWPPGPAHGDAFVYSSRPGTVGLVDSRSGARIWQIEDVGVEPDWIVSDSRAIVIAGVRGPIAALGRESGARLWLHEIPRRRVVALALADDALWLLTLDGAPSEIGPDRPELIAIDRRTGRIQTTARWSTIIGDNNPYVRSGLDELGLWITKTSVFVSPGDGILRAFDRATGVQRWHWGIGLDSQVALARSPAGNARPVVANHQGRVVIFELGLASVAPHRVELTGRVAIGDEAVASVPMVVGDSLVTTDDDGNFTATVATRGEIQIHMGRPCDEVDYAVEGNATVSVDGTATSIQVDIAAERDRCD